MIRWRSGYEWHLYMDSVELLSSFVGIMQHNTEQCVQEAMRAARLQPHQIAALGITNQRETTIVWNRYVNEILFLRLNPNLVLVTDTLGSRTTMQSCGATIEPLRSASVSHELVGKTGCDQRRVFRWHRTSLGQNSCGYWIIFQGFDKTQKGKC